MPITMVPTKLLFYTPVEGVEAAAEPERPPNWHRYRDEARRIVAAFEALTGTIASGS